MKPFKFFQKERKPMFSGIIERLQTVTNGIQGEYRLPHLEDRVTDNAREYFRNQFEHYHIDGEVIQMVEEYFNYYPNTHKQTETLLIDIVNHHIEHNGPSNDFHTLNIDVNLINAPHGRVRYVITRNEGGFVYIREKRIERRDMF